MPSESSTPSTRDEVSLVIKRLGGPNLVAALCEIEHSSVCQWRNSTIPKARLMYLQAVRPDVFVGTQWEVKNYVAQRKAKAVVV